MDQNNNHVEHLLRLVKTGGCPDIDTTTIQSVLYDAIKKIVEEDSLEVDAFNNFSPFKSCEDAKEEEWKELEKLQKLEGGLRSNHKECRGAEKADHDDLLAKARLAEGSKVDREGKCEDNKALKPPLESNLCPIDAQHLTNDNFAETITALAKHLEQTEKDIHQAEEICEGAKQSERTSFGDRDAAEQQLKRTTKSCNWDQNSLEFNICGQYSIADAANTAYKNCRDEAEKTAERDIKRFEQLLDNHNHLYTVAAGVICKIRKGTEQGNLREHCSDAKPNPDVVLESSKADHNWPHRTNPLPLKATPGDDSFAAEQGYSFMRNSTEAFAEPNPPVSCPVDADDDASTMTHSTKQCKIDFYAKPDCAGQAAYFLRPTNSANQHYMAKIHATSVKVTGCDNVKVETYDSSGATHATTTSEWTWTDKWTRVSTNNFSSSEEGGGGGDCQSFMGSTVISKVDVNPYGGSSSQEGGQMLLGPGEGQLRDDDPMLVPEKPTPYVSADTDSGRL